MGEKGDMAGKKEVKERKRKKTEGKNAKFKNIGTCL